MKLDIEQDSNLVGGPVLVAETHVYDLSAMRRRREVPNLQEAKTLVETSGDESHQCVDGVCVLAWRPRRPQGDVA